jgi:hypothetical protein
MTRQGVLRHFVVEAEALHEVTASPFAFAGQQMPLNRVRPVEGRTYVAQHVGPGSIDNQFVLLRGDSGDLDRSFTDDVGSIYDDTVSKYTLNLVAKAGSIAAFYTYHNTVSFFDSSGRPRTRIGTGEVPADARSWGNRTVVRQSICGADNSIFVLAWHATENEALNESREFRPLLEKWSWEGQLLDEYVLDQPIHLCTYSPRDGHIYGYSAFAPDSLFRYNLSVERSPWLSDPTSQHEPG